jgi:hypothetical protein
VEDSIILRAWERATARVAEHSITLKRTLKYCFCPDYFRVREPKLLEHRSSTGVEIRHKELELRHAILKIDLELMILIRETFHGEKLNMEHIKMLADNFILRHTVQECANLRLLNSDNKYLAVCELCEELEFSMSEVKGLIGKYELILGLSSK